VKVRCIPGCNHVGAPKHTALDEHDSIKTVGSDEDGALEGTYDGAQLDAKEEEGAFEGAQLGAYELEGLCDGAKDGAYDDAEHGVSHAVNVIPEKTQHTGSEYSCTTTGEPQSPLKVEPLHPPTSPDVGAITKFVVGREASLV
jgi:hypothetical protein